LTDVVASPSSISLLVASYGGVGRNLLVMRHNQVSESRFSSRSRTKFGSLTCSLTRLLGVETISALPLGKTCSILSAAPCTIGVLFLFPKIRKRKPCGETNDVHHRQIQLQPHPQLVRFPLVGNFFSSTG
jgi:hypothetical protein